MDDHPLERFEHLPNFHLATMKLVELLRSTDAQKLTDDDLSAAAGGSVGPHGEHENHLYSACRYTLRTSGRVWKRLRGEKCLVLLNPDERISLSESRRRSQHRASKKSVAILLTIDPSTLTPDRQGEYRTTLAMHGALASMSSSTMRKRLLESGGAKTPELPDLLAAMTRENGDREAARPGQKAAKER